jgi:hypothetical protein
MVKGYMRNDADADRNADVDAIRNADVDADRRLSKVLLKAQKSVLSQRRRKCYFIRL